MESARRRKTKLIKFLAHLLGGTSCNRRGKCHIGWNTGSERHELSLVRPGMQIDWNINDMLTASVDLAGSLGSHNGSLFRPSATLTGEVGKGWSGVVGIQATDQTKPVYFAGISTKL